LRTSIWMPILFLLSFTVLAATFEQASAGGSIQGTVYARNYMGDYRQTGWANITVAGTSNVYPAQFNQGGYYTVFLPNGNYMITCNLPGYKEINRQVSVSDGSATSLNFYMEQSGVPIPEFHEYLTPIMASMALLMVLILQRKRASSIRFPN
jgi:hypothetical protein